MVQRDRFCRSRLIALVLCLAFLQGCMRQVPTARPGAVDRIDSEAFDVLATSAKVIESAKLEYAAGKLPANSKPFINAMVASYDAAREAWLGYRSLVAAGKSGDAAQLTDAIARLTLTITRFTTSTGRATP